MRKHNQSIKDMRFWVQSNRRSLSILLNVAIGVLVVVQYVNHKQAQRFAGYEEVVCALQAGELRPDTDGVIRLPARWTWLTEEGRVYKCQDKQNSVRWLFPTSVRVYRSAEIYGVRSEVRSASGYIYSVDRPEARYFPFYTIEGVYPRQSVPTADHWWYAEPYDD